MWRIIRLLSRFGNFLLFLLLEVVALAIIVSLNKPHKDISQGILTEISGNFAEVQRSVYGYFNLRSENEKLLHQNAELDSTLRLYKDSLDAVLNRVPANLSFRVLPDSVQGDSVMLAETKRRELPDSLLPVSGFRLIPCRAVNNTYDRNYNYITINKGRNHGVVKDMGLISPQGIAGQVVGVSANYALALSVLNKKFRTGAKLLRNSNMGTLAWEGDKPEFARLDFIPQTSIIHKGDTVITSGYSTVFPPDYLIGTVHDFITETQDGFFHITVKLSTNFKGLDNLYLVRHVYRTEIDSLEKTKLAE